MMKKLIVSDFTVSHLPEVVRIEPSGICNLRCTHCPTGTMDSKESGIMIDETFEIVLENLREIKPRVVVMYHGGEPFLNKYIFQWIKIIKSMGIGFVKINTNGMLLTNNKLVRIIESGLDLIEFSLDGKSPTENNAIRVGSNYHKVAKTIKTLIKLKEKIGSDKPNIHIFNVQIAKNNKIAPIAVPQFLLNDFSGIYEGKLFIKSSFSIDWAGTEITKNMNNPPDMNYCENPIKLITIRWNGDIVPCCYDITSNYVIGNIKESSIAEIWNNEKYRNLRKSINNKQYLPLCENCNNIRTNYHSQKE